MSVSDLLADRLTLSAVRLTRWLRAADPSPRLSGPQASALAVVVHAGRLRMSDLAAFEEVSRPTITRVAAELRGLGLIVREPDPTDGRVSWLAATDAGRALLAAGQARRIAPLADAVAALPADRRAALVEGLAVLEAVLAEAVPPRAVLASRPASP